MVTPKTSRAVLGVATIAFAVAFNVPYSILAATFDYPAILRRPAGEILMRFNAGGGSLILTWHAFALAALLFAPLAIAVSLRGDRLTTAPALTVGAAIAGSLAGLAQAIGLWRWVFVVPTLARNHAAPEATAATKLAAESSFDLINLYGGVAIGEHLGQLLTALFVVMLSLVQWREANRLTSVIGLVTAACLAVGTNEGLAIALNRSGNVFSVFTIVAFLGLTVWLIATGITVLRTPGLVPHAAT